MSGDSRADERGVFSLLNHCKITTEQTPRPKYPLVNEASTCPKWPSFFCRLDRKCERPLGALQAFRISLVRALYLLARLHTLGVPWVA